MPDLPKTKLELQTETIRILNLPDAERAKVLIDLKDDGATCRIPTISRLAHAERLKIAAAIEQLTNLQPGDV